MVGIKAIIFDFIGTLYDFDGNPFPFSEKVLKELNPRYKLAVISKAKPESTQKRLRQIGELGDYFEKVVVDSVKTKGHYLDCINSLGVLPEETLIVDDRMIRGVEIGNKLGCQTYWIQNGKYAHETPNAETGEPTRTIKSVEDLLTLL